MNLDSSEIELHSYAYCEREKLPYIKISSLNHKYDEIFYDITFLPIDYKQISRKIEAIYKSYIEFYSIPYNDVTTCFDMPHLFFLYIRKEHSEKIAKQLYRYLIQFL